LGGSPTHLLGILELGNDYAAEPQSDLTNHLRGYSRHQDFYGLRHSRVKTMPRNR
jgi:hypothetical protein